MLFDEVANGSDVCFPVGMSMLGSDHVVLNASYHPRSALILSDV